MCPPAHTHGGSTHRCSPTIGDLTMRYRYKISKFLISSESPILESPNHPHMVRAFKRDEWSIDCSCSSPIIKYNRMTDCVSVTDAYQ